MRALTGMSGCSSFQFGFVIGHCLVPVAVLDEDMKNVLDPRVAPFPAGNGQKPGDVKQSGRTDGRAGLTRLRSGGRDESL